jgi:uncharacterized damage-inducible protein DinB
MEDFYLDYLDRLKFLHEEIFIAIDALPQEAMDWVPLEGIPSIGILVAHLTGAERYWIGDIASGDPSGRVREAEFTVAGISKGELKQRLLDTYSYAEKKIMSFQKDDLNIEQFSPPRDGEKITRSWAILHALEHTGIHLGHVQIIRQLWQADLEFLSEK